MEQIQEDSLTIVNSTMFKLTNPGEYSEKYHYSRYGNPSRDLLESSLASLDGGNFAVAYCSSTAAGMAVLSLMKPDDLVVFSDVLNCEKFKKLFPKLSLESGNFDDLKNFEKSFKPNTKMFYIESLVNPTMKVLDIKTIAAFIHANSDAILAVDNTLITSHFQKPLELGADIIVYSVNEYIGGHDDVNMGAVITKDKSYYDKLRYYQVSAGTVPSPFDCFMISRSLKTFSLRMERHSQNSLAVLEFLKSHSKVDNVFHASLNRECEGKSSCGILSFYIEGEFEGSQKFLNALKIIKISQSLGGNESKVSFPWTMSHVELTERQRLELGVNKSLIRLSVGLEQAEKIINDLDEALKQI